jgi:hypothetical protein
VRRPMEEWQCIIQDAYPAYISWTQQIPPDFVVKFQRVDIVDAILWFVLQPRVVYQRRIKG